MSDEHGDDIAAKPRSKRKRSVLESPKVPDRSDSSEGELSDPPEDEDEHSSPVEPPKKKRACQE
ncbi:hypothetical protein B0H67DRAFT_649091 [Lasiosphaeris hirsuta]|uniref:Uncharacterized protein n=1 Tax=Lasiosphaeris hirsuta TaxID=260670 RepID=A0AA39ZW67_9PEZI|nr:hypothetical protein B0H67DRAFT_649091 [Lasiosphaeris hirsuta]